jgi:hypothetical protein
LTQIIRLLTLILFHRRRHRAFDVVAGSYRPLNDAGSQTFNTARFIRPPSSFRVDKPRDIVSYCDFTLLIGLTYICFVVAFSDDIFGGYPAPKNNDGWSLYIYIYIAIVVTFVTLPSSKTFSCCWLCFAASIKRRISSFDDFFQETYPSNTPTNNGQSRRNSAARASSATAILASSSAMAVRRFRFPFFIGNSSYVKTVLFTVDLFACSLIRHESRRLSESELVGRLSERDDATQHIGRAFDLDWYRVESFMENIN